MVGFNRTRYPWSKADCFTFHLSSLLLFIIPSVFLEHQAKSETWSDELCCLEASIIDILIKATFKKSVIVLIFSRLSSDLLKYSIKEVGSWVISKVLVMSYFYVLCIYKQMGIYLLCISIEGTQREFSNLPCLFDAIYI